MKNILLIYFYILSFIVYWILLFNELNSSSYDMIIFIIHIQSLNMIILIIIIIFLCNDEYNFILDEFVYVIWLNIESLFHSISLFKFGFNNSLCFYLYVSYYLFHSIEFHSFIEWILLMILVLISHIHNNYNNYLRYTPNSH